MLRTRLSYALAIGLPTAAFLIGWREFWFLTDDAYIAFRYVSNHQLGHGFVWNAPPFLPVEGYTSFLWVLMMDWSWSIFGVEPPRSANVLAFIFSLASLALTAIWANRIRVGPDGRTWRPLWLALVLASCVGNRSFLAWSSSGLETAMFNFLCLAWLFAVFMEDLPWRRFAIMTLAALLALTRPDGLLYLAASVVMHGAALRQHARRERLKASEWLPLALLLIPAGHLLWRHSFYGEWLPNTYFAKNTGAWPASGLRFAACFILEYALAFWLVLAATWAVALVRRRVSRPSAASRRIDSGEFTRCLAVATVVAHVGYYTLIVGGDHFEFRVYSHLIPLIGLSFVGMLSGLQTRSRWALIFFSSWLVCSWLIPWTHWSKTHRLRTRRQTFALAMPLAASFPQPARAYVELFDRYQSWLIERAVGVRHQEHKVFHRGQIKKHPSRGVGATVGPEGFPIANANTVGVTGWTLPHVSIIDVLGLNDYVVARNPQLRSDRLKMAHRRQPPEGYVASYQPNVAVVNKTDAIALPRKGSFGAEDIRRLESRWRRWVDRERAGGE